MSREILKELVERHGADLPLARAALAATSPETPEVDPEACLDQLQDWADQVLAVDLSPIEAMHRVLFEQLGFSGNREDYYRPENSFLSRVMASRQGLPLTLSVVYVEVARRAGLDASGISFPAHFIVQVPDGADGAGRTFVDPFHAGRRFAIDQLPGLLEEVLGNPAPLEPWMLRPARNAEVVLRLLANLKLAYIRRNELADAIGVLERMMVLQPDDVALLQERGALYARIGLYPAAVRDLEAVLAAGVSEDEARRIEHLLPKLRSSVASMN